MSALVLGPGGEIALPEQVLRRYGMKPSSAMRIVETGSGILLIPLTRNPMPDELQREITEWQSLGAETWDQFEYKDSNGSR